MLLDNGLLQIGDDALAGTRHPVVARLSAATAAEIGATAALRITGPGGSVVLPLEVTDALPDRTVWLPLNSTPGGAHRALGTTVGHLVTIAPAQEA
jgi:NADH-quinone oxidoreductase subunit G